MPRATNPLGSPHAARLLPKPSPTLKEKTMNTRHAARLSVVATMFCFPAAASANFFGAEQAKLLASDGATNDSFGRAVDNDAGTVVVGAPNVHADVDGDGVTEDLVGAAYVYVGSDTSWTEQATLTASDAEDGAEFGTSAAVDGDTIVVGAPRHGHYLSGAAYVFVRSGGVWVEQQRLFPDDATNFQSFGHAVDIVGDTLLVTAPADDEGPGNNAGAAYIFTRSAGTWTQQAKLMANDAAANDRFGRGGALEQDTVVLGARLDDIGALSTGSAYVFARSGATWSQEAKLVAPDPEANDFFGQRVAISGETVVVPVELDDDDGASSGSAYVYAKTSGAWALQQKLTASDAAAGDFFGVDAAIDGDLLLIGAEDDSDDVLDGGSVYVFTRTGTTWTEVDEFRSGDLAVGDQFSNALSLSGGTAVIGAPLDADNGPVSGSAYIFSLVGPPTANNYSWATPEDVVLTVAAPGVLANDEDPSGTGLTASLATAPTHGDLVVSPDGSFVYTPDADYFGWDAFTYTIVDGNGESDWAEISLNVTWVNDAPVAYDDEATTDEDVAVTIDVLANDVDVELDLLAVWSVTDGAHGTVVEDVDGTVTYQPDPAFVGSDSFEYTVSDLTGGYDSATVTVVVESVAPACTLSMGYWKTHPDAWPVESMELGDWVLTKEEALDILRTPPRGNAWIILTRQLVATYLNWQSGAPIYDIVSVMQTANNWLADHLDGYDPDRHEGLALASTLADFNEGLTGPGHCD
jgi:hypothetical protein